MGFVMTEKIKSLNIDIARKHALEVSTLGTGGIPNTGTSTSTPFSLNTPDILNSLISITSNPFFDSSSTNGGGVNGGTNKSSSNGSSSPSSSSGGSVGEDEKKTFLTLESPQSSVQGVQSALIKEGLKFSIISKRKQIGKEVLDIKSEIDLANKTRKREELTPEDEERRKRRRERNKIAATKCRNKKREKTFLLVKESESLEGNNVCLKSEISKLEIEKQRLMEVLRAHANNSNSLCKKNNPTRSSYNNHNHNNFFDQQQTIQL